MIIPYYNLKPQHQEIKKELNLKFSDIMKSGNYVQGPEIVKFEKNFSNFLNAPYCIGLNSGTSALHLALLSLGIGKGDEVITTPLTFVATIAAILYTGAKPILVDIDEDTYNIDSQKIEQAITKKTKAIIPVHLHGRISNMKKILTISKKYNLSVVEDSSQAHGAKQNKKYSGTLGRIGTFSFYPAKTLGAMGDAGALVTSDKKIYKKCKMLRSWGENWDDRNKRGFHILHGYNYRISSLQASVINIKIKKLKKWNFERLKIADFYYKNLSNCNILLPKKSSKGEHVYHIFAIRHKNREKFRYKLLKKGIATGVHYHMCIHEQPAYRKILPYKRDDFPIAEKIAKEMVSLPIWPYMTKKQLNKICESIRKIG